MQNQPLISIVTPSYNQGGTIEHTIRSILDQGYDRFEHFVMDGGSTDETVSVLERYPHLHWRSEPDRGQTHAINKGLALAKGEVFAYLNSDDVYRPGCFEQVAQAFADPECQVLVGGCDLIDASGAVTGHDAAQLERHESLGCFWLWGSGVLIPQPAVFIRKSLLEQAGPFDESYDMAMDLEMWLRLARRTRFHLVPETLAGFRVTADTKTSTRPADMVEDSRRAALAHIELTPPAEREQFRRELERQTAGHLLTVAEQRRDRALAWRALKHQPSAIFSRRLLRALLLALLLTLPAAAWGPRGHRVVGLIAENRMADTTREAVAELLDGERLSEAALWADAVRGQPEWRHSAPWHYVNIDDGRTYATSRKDSRGDVIEAIERFRSALQDRRAPKHRRSEALRFLAHFVGDVHQPLHVGRREDRGGNEIRVRFFGQESNLHRVSDSGLLGRFGRSSNRLAPYLEQDAPRDAHKWGQDPLMTWMEESFRARRAVYQFRGGELGQDYFERHRELLRRRLLQAGVRLAALLDAALSDGSSPR